MSDASNVVTVKIDKTPPTITAAATSDPNGAGWYNHNVTVHFSCDDSLSGSRVGRARPIRSSAAKVTRSPPLPRR